MHSQIGKDQAKFEQYNSQLNSMINAMPRFSQDLGHNFDHDHRSPPAYMHATPSCKLSFLYDSGHKTCELKSYMLLFFYKILVILGVMPSLW